MAIIGGESVVYEGTLDGNKVAVKKPILSTTEDINKFHKELQLLWYFIFLSLHVLSILWHVPSFKRFLSSWFSFFL